MNPEKIHVLLYSFSQGAYHVENLGETMRSGLRAIYRKRPNDYIVIHAADTRAEIDQVYEKLTTETRRIPPTKSP